MSGKTIQRDEFQRQVLALKTGHHLVLAPPGCGKTDILAERIANAITDGVQPEDILCLTFTNRAARGMKERVQAFVGRDKAAPIFIGNIHRYCSQFLFQNALVPLNTSILDEDDVKDILTDLYQRTNDNEPNAKWMKNVRCLARYRYQVEFEHPAPLREQKQQEKADVIANYEAYLQNESDPEMRELVASADAYREYKKIFSLLDFDDLLLQAYTYLARSDIPHKRYRMIHVDEVQDLSALQLACIDLLTADNPSVLYLGDEQQSIFSFNGADLSILDSIRKRCNGTCLLKTNYRSPQYLLDVLNTYAIETLGLDKSYLPEGTDSEKEEDSLLLINTDSKERQYDCVTKLIQRWNAKEKQKTAVLVTKKRGR